MKNIDQVKVRIRGHAPYCIEEKEFSSVEDAIWWLHQFKYCKNDI